MFPKPFSFSTKFMWSIHHQWTLAYQRLCLYANSSLRDLCTNSILSTELQIYTLTGLKCWLPYSTLGLGHCFSPHTILTEWPVRQCAWAWATSIHGITPSWSPKLASVEQNMGGHCWTHQKGLLGSKAASQVHWSEYVLFPSGFWIKESTALAHLQCLFNGIGFGVWLGVWKWSPVHSSWEHCIFEKI